MTINPFIFAQIDLAASASAASAVTSTSAASAVTSTTASDVSIDQIIAAFSGHQTLLATGLGLSFILAFINKMGWLKWLTPKAIPWVGVLVGLLGGVANNLISGMPLQVALMNGFMAGVVATGAWELVLQHVPGIKPKV